ncbi:MAG: imidazoleglycerol-phosphate dehydratase HisB [Eubacteriales bacterium]
MRRAEINRKTNETDIALSLTLDGTGKSEISTDSGFFHHMLTLFASHSRMDLKLTCDGDSEVDFHHTVEDIGISLGQALVQGLGDKRGICRYGTFVIPMDEALIEVSLDLSGRGLLTENITLKSQKVGDFDTELCKEFLMALAREGGITLHVVQIRGENSHHIIEGIFKALARALRIAISIDPQFSEEIPSTKGLLS